MGLRWVYSAGQRVARRLPMGLSCFTKLAYGSTMVHSRVSHRFTVLSHESIMDLRYSLRGGPRVTHGSPMGLPVVYIAHPLKARGQPMGYSAGSHATHGSRMCLPIIYRRPMDCSWVSQRLTVLAHGSPSPIGRPWVTHAFTVLAHESPMSLPLVYS